LAWHRPGAICDCLNRLPHEVPSYALAIILTIYIRGPRADPWRTPCFSVPQSEKGFCAVLGDFTSHFFY
jgi:hypothetical protein